MLGGSVYIAFIRFAVSLAGVILLFSRMSRSRFSRKKTIFCYGAFSAVVLVLACIWYVADWESCVRAVVFVMYLCFMVFAIFMSSDSVYLSVYKLALTFYLLAVFLIGGLETAIIFFDRNVWADIIMRILLISLMTFLIEKKLKCTIREFSDYVENEVDKFSVAVMIISILFGIGFIMNPTLRDADGYRIYQIITNFVLTGTLQLLMFRFYLHIGKEKKYERENQLMQMNHRLLERELEILEDSVEAGKRVRHDQMSRDPLPDIHTYMNIITWDDKIASYRVVYPPADLTKKSKTPLEKNTSSCYDKHRKDLPPSAGRSIIQ